MDTQLIVLAEHDPLIAQTYSDFLTEKGFTVLIEPYGENVLYRLREKKPALLIMNTELPHKDGFSILEERSKEDSLLEIPVILLTENNKVADIERAGKLGIHEYFHNTNVDAEALCAKVEEILG